MSDKTRFTERGVEEDLSGPEIMSTFTWENTPELLHVGLTDLYSGGMHGGKLATVSTVWLPANRAMGDGIAEYDREAGEEVMMNDVRFMRAGTIMKAFQDAGRSAPPVACMCPPP